MMAPIDLHAEGILESLRMVIETQAIHSKWLEILVTALAQADPVDNTLIRTLRGISEAMVSQNTSMRSLDEKISGLPQGLKSALETELRAILSEPDP